MDDERPADRSESLRHERMGSANPAAGRRMATRRKLQRGRRDNTHQQEARSCIARGWHDSLRRWHHVNPEQPRQVTHGGELVWRGRNHRWRHTVAFEKPSTPKRGTCSHCTPSHECGATGVHGPIVIDRACGPPMLAPKRPPDPPTRGGSADRGRPVAPNARLQ